MPKAAKESGNIDAKYLNRSSVGMQLVNSATGILPSLLFISMAFNGWKLPFKVLRQSFAFPSDIASTETIVTARKIGLAAGTLAYCFYAWAFFNIATNGSFVSQRAIAPFTAVKIDRYTYLIYLCISCEPLSPSGRLRSSSKTQAVRQRVSR